MSTASPDSFNDLFLADGSLDRTLFEPDALDVLDSCTTWLNEVARTVYVPIDLLMVLAERGHDDLLRVVIGTARTNDDATSLVDHLRSLARRVERDAAGPARLHLENLSLGFTGIISDALSWARETGRRAARESDIVRVVRWRAELQESASVRWAIRQLAQPGGEFLFDVDGALRRAAFSPELWQVFQTAMRLSCQTGLAFLGTPHLMAALCLRRGAFATACEAAGQRPRKVHDALLAIVGTRGGVQADFSLTRQTLTPRTVRMLAHSVRQAEEQGRVIGEPELLEAFLIDGGSSLEAIRTLGVEPHIRRVLEAAPPSREHRVSVLGGAPIPAGAEPTAETPTLDSIGRDLSADAAAGKIPPILGREEELQRIVNVLMRTEQRNPLLTGDPGVGKTALAMALAIRIHEGKVPTRLQGMRVVEINGASLVGGTSYRGELENRIKALLAECADKVILFMDEAHAVFAPKSSSGQPAEIPNHFKAALASGRIAVVAATTEAEYRRWIEEDPALRRRFERIEISPLTAAITRNVLASLAPEFERTYDVPIHPDAVDAAVELSVRFMPEQSLPDKAKKLLMDATISVSAQLALSGHKQPGGDHDTPNKRIVSRMDIARQIALKTGAPLDRIARGTIGWWAGIEERLNKYVVGQERGVHLVAQSLIAARLNSAGRKRPQCVFMFAGPPGVGKTDLARGLAAEIYGHADAMLQLDMGDFQESHSISRLIGSPPGYVGYQDEDALVTPLRRNPSVVVYLKDFDLAHPRVQERFVRLFEDGEISDTRGLKADASHAIFVLSMNVEPSARSSIGFSQQREIGDEATFQRIAPDVAERLKGHAIEFVLFQGLDGPGRDLAAELFQVRFRQFRETLADEYSLQLVLSPETEAEILERVRALKDAREIERFFRKHVIEPVSQQLIAGVTESSISIEAPREKAPV